MEMVTIHEDQPELELTEKTKKKIVKEIREKMEERLGEAFKQYGLPKPMSKMAFKKEFKSPDRMSVVSMMEHHMLNKTAFRGIVINLGKEGLLKEREVPQELKYQILNLLEEPLDTEVELFEVNLKYNHFIVRVHNPKGKALVGGIFGKTMKPDKEPHNYIGQIREGETIIEAVERDLEEFPNVVKYMLGYIIEEDFEKNWQLGKDLQESGSRYDKETDNELQEYLTDDMKTVVRGN